jgi:hypothetical protein
MPAGEISPVVVFIENIYIKELLESSPSLSLPELGVMSTWSRAPSTGYICGNSRPII